MNKVILMGRLTRDPNVRYTQQNSSQESMCVARYTLAVDRWGQRDGQPSADFISCVAFMLWTERRWSEQSAIFTYPENRSMYNSSSYDIIKQRETRRGFICKTQVTNKCLKNARK